jgi:hypothetical protein
MQKILSLFAAFPRNLRRMAENLVLRLCREDVRKGTFKDLRVNFASLEDFKG